MLFYQMSKYSFTFKGNQHIAIKKLTQKNSVTEFLTSDPEPLPLKNDFCMLVCFVFMFAQIYVFILYQRYKLLENSKKEFQIKRSKNWKTGLVKPTSTIKTWTVFRGCNVCYQVFLAGGKTDFKRKIWNFNISLQT